VAFPILSLTLFSGLPQARSPEPDPLHARAEALRSELDGEFTVLVEEPFVVVGDESPGRVERRAKETVRWAVRHLMRDYFPEVPDEPLTIWLFADERSYRRNALRFFGDRPDTPYGYYSPSHRALVMNIATGGGTLVHEIVHPFIEKNFEACPAWFNEGLGSLYEQSSERDGHIVGLTNWRLAGLQSALEKGTVPPLRTLLRTTDRAFYREDPGTNYAQARYVLMYLQEKGLLRSYYRAFRDGHDPTGHRPMLEVLGVKSLEAFEAEWKEWVLSLRFEP
jgi:hypothetical protein